MWRRGAVLGLIVVGGCVGGGEGGPFWVDLVVLTTGGGTVTSDPPGHLMALDCGASCKTSFDVREHVTLTATPDPGQQFLGWAGPCAGTGPCELSIDDYTEVVARFGSPETSWAHVMSDPTGNPIGAGVAASIAGDLLIGTGSARSDESMTIARIAVDGVERWHDTATANTTATAIVGDGAGTIYVGGRSLGPWAVAGLAPVDGGAFVVQLGDDGHGIGIDVFTSSRQAVVLGAALDVDGKLAVTGEFLGDVRIGSQNFTSAGGSDVFVATRATPWSALQIGTSGFDRALGMAETGDGRLWLLVALGDVLTTPVGPIGPGLGLLVLEDMQPIAVQTFGGPPPPDPVAGTGFGPTGAIAAMPDSGVVITASFEDRVEIGAAGELVAFAKYDWFLARMSATGDVTWARRHGGAADDWARAVATDGQLAYVGGAFEGALDFGDSPPFATSESATNGFVAAYDLTAGALRWVRRLGPVDGFGTINGVATTGLGVFAAGSMSDGPMALGDTVTPVPRGGVGVGVLIVP